MPDPLTPDERAAIRARYPEGEHYEASLVAMGMRALEDVPRLLRDLDVIRDDLDARVPARDLGDRHHARALIEEVGHLRDACKTLGGIIDRQCIDIAKIARSEHLVSDDGDADWGVIWEQAYEIADRAEKAEAEVAKLREKIDVDRAMHEAFRPEVVAEVAVLVCDEMDWQAVADWCGGTIGSTQDPSGEYTSSLTIPGVGSAGEGQWIVQRHDGTFAIRATLEGPSAESVARLTARPAPTWDEDAVREEARTLASAGPRFWPRVKVGSKTECWPWTGPALPFGHGTWDGPYGKTTAHRYAWALANAGMPASGAVIRHRCDNPICCNPDHLEPGSQEENVRDMIERGRASFTDTLCRNGHDRTPDNILTKADGTRRCKECSRAQQAERRKGYVPLRCLYCDHAANVYNLRRHIQRVHGDSIGATELRARAARLAAEGGADHG